MPANENRVAAVVVTFNRKELLKECIEALLQQSFKEYDILIIDNASTDGTVDYISDYIEKNAVQYYNTGKNLGGAGGFNYGVKKAVENGYGYIWLMDDDTIPYTDSLAELIKADNILTDKKINYGFLSSTAVWKDGTACKMNRQLQVKDWYNYSELLREGIIKVFTATFVSFFIKAAVVKDMGLPISEFFIWSDDVEYSGRIAKKYPCYVAGRSQVLHSTANNDGSDIARDNGDRLNRYKFAYRNEVYIAKRNGIKSMGRQFFKICIHLWRILLHSNGKRFKKMWIVISASFKGLFFCPKIEYV